jgi:hypothetical protein
MVRTHSLFSALAITLGFCSASAFAGPFDSMKPPQVKMPEAQAPAPKEVAKKEAEATEEEAKAKAKAEAKAEGQGKVNEVKAKASNMRAKRLKVKKPAMPPGGT